MNIKSIVALRAMQGSVKVWFVTLISSVCRSAGGPPTNPALFAQMLQNLSPVQRNQMAAMMGVSPQQLAQVYLPVILPV